MVDLVRVLAPVLFVGAALCLAAPSFAAGGKSKGAGNRVEAGFEIAPLEDEEALRDDEVPAADSPRIIVIPTVAVPVVRDGWLENYLFVLSQVEVNDGVNSWSVRAKSHYMRDAIIKRAHTTSLGLADNASALDEERAQAVFLDAIESVVGPGQIKRLDILGADSKR